MVYLFFAFAANASTITITNDTSTLTASSIYFSSSDSSYLYRAKIDAFSYHFSGIMVIKKLDNSMYRSAFTTETGFKLFDLALEGDKAKVMYVMKEMNNPLFLKLIKEDILLMLQLSPSLSVKEQGRSKAPCLLNDTCEVTMQKGIQYVFFNNQLLNIQKQHKEKTLVDIQFEERNASLKSNLIYITHRNIPVMVSLSAFYNVSEETE